MFWNKKKKSEETNPVETMSKEERYGEAWRKIVGLEKRGEGFHAMSTLCVEGFAEAAVVMAMFADGKDVKLSLIKKAADAGNCEGLWQYSNFLPHNYVPDPTDPDDALWETTCRSAAEKGSVDAMNEMGNVFHRRREYVESMYWYAMANAHGQRDGKFSMKHLAEEWVRAGMPVKKSAGGSESDTAKRYCALAYLKIHAGKKPDINMDQIMRYVLQGIPIAAYLAGDIFEDAQDYKMAYTVYNAISFENDAHGLRCYADMLMFGKGVDRDPASAFRFYHEAATRGDREAMFIMGQLYRTQNANMAAYWYGLAHTRGYEDAIDGLVALKLT